MAASRKRYDLEAYTREREAEAAHSVAYNSTMIDRRCAICDGALFDNHCTVSEVTPGGTIHYCQEHIPWERIRAARTGKTVGAPA